MSKVRRLVNMQKLPLPLEKAWQFFSDPQNLLTITPPFLNLKVTNEVFGDKIYSGQIISYKVRPLAGIAVSWTTEITGLQNEKIFVDEQKKGPYKLWHHQHHFKSIKDGTEMVDIVHYCLPLGIIGELVHPVVKQKLIEIFTYRFNKINDLFGNWPGQKINLMID